ncbi:hypothetical protein TeGR_g15300, partial [Tetraparma gracilis]
PPSPPRAQDRISAKEALNHPYFDDLEKDSI